MKNSMNKLNQSRKSYFSFDFDPSLSNDHEILDDFYSKKFQEFSKENYFVHHQIPSEIKTSANTGCLIDRQITSNLYQLVEMCHGKQLPSKKNLNTKRITLLKNFKYYDGFIKKTQIIVRAIKQQKREGANTYSILHFFHLKSKLLDSHYKEGEELQRQPTIYEDVFLQNMNEDLTMIDVQLSESQKKSYHQSNLHALDLREKEETDNTSTNYDQVNISDNKSSNSDKNKSNYPIFKYNLRSSNKPQNLSVQITKQSSRNTEKTKTEMVQLEFENQRDEAEQQAKYYKNLYIKEQIKNKEQSKKLHEIEIKILRQQLLRSELSSDGNDANLDSTIIID